MRDNIIYFIIFIIALLATLYGITRQQENIKSIMKDPALIEERK